MQAKLNCQTPCWSRRPVKLYVTDIDVSSGNPIQAVEVQVLTRAAFMDDELQYSWLDDAPAEYDYTLTPSPKGKCVLAFDDLLAAAAENQITTFAFEAEHGYSYRTAPFDIEGLPQLLTYFTVNIRSVHATYKGDWVTVVDGRVTDPTPDQHIDGDDQHTAVAAAIYGSRFYYPAQSPHYLLPPIMGVSIDPTKGQYTPRYKGHDIMAERDRRFMTFRLVSSLGRWEYITLKGRISQIFTTTEGTQYYRKLDEVVSFAKANQWDDVQLFQTLPKHTRQLRFDGPNVPYLLNICRELILSPYVEVYNIYDGATIEEVTNAAPPAEGKWQRVMFSPQTIESGPVMTIQTISLEMELQE